ncbi:MAG: tRNA epoxyqueuosine(34) reductase QueG [bacterium]|nr:tRNA epoxyqueuosine(34) reductase QueG [bacterium]
MKLYEQLKLRSQEAGCAGFGVTGAEPFDAVADTIERRRAAGLAGNLQFTYKQPETATAVTHSFAWARSIVVVSWSYLPEAGSPGEPSPGVGRIARFATEDHYRGLREALASLQALVVGAGWRAEVLVDDDRLVDRAAAVRAGVAWWGKSSLVLDPRHGPWLLLGSLVTDADLPADEPMVRDCGTCDACMPACPTGAIVAPGVLDASLCLAHWMQVGGPIPVELRAPMGDRVYGCDDCLDVCPPGFKRLTDVAVGPGRVDLLELLATDDKTLLEKYSHFYVPRRRPRFLRRNAIVALANSIAQARQVGAVSSPATADAQAVLAGYLGDPDDLYRSHAAWAIGRIGGEQAVPLLQHQLGRERVDSVIVEIEAALAVVGSE